MRRAGLISALLALTVLLSVVAAAAQQEPYVTDAEIFVAAPDELPCAVEQVEGSLAQAVSPGSVVYFSIANAQRAEDLTGFRAFVECVRGEPHIGEPRIEYRKVLDKTGTVSLGYRYLVALPLLDASDAEDYLVSGNIRISQRASTAAVRRKFSLVLRRGSRMVTSDSIVCDAQYLPLEFSGQSAVTLYFYDMARFEVDVSGQGVLNVGCSTEALTDIQLRYPEAKLRFLHWARPPIFNRAGTLFLYADAQESLYELRADGIYPVPNAFSEADEAFVLTTRRLGAYVISDRPLSPQQTPAALPNPPTGQNLA